jgi:2-polyprenyl-3-methyl-5-hydroxy-6-metoxy-1,4-benzoquinol methylase
MNWQQFWNDKGINISAQEQVARVLKGEPMKEDLLAKIAAKVSVQLELKKEDKLLDICCGNGALTKLLLPYCDEIVAVDFSEKLIDNAKQFGSNRIQFICENATEFSLNQSFDKVLLYFSFQYFESYEEGKQVITNLIKHARSGAIILIGDITDKRHFFNYYNSPKKLFHWIKQRLINKNDMGKFWHPNELLKICDELNVEGTVIKQELWQPYAHYRFDFIIKTNS